jgi:ribosomal protein S12 methylthiotransferase accessory factor
VNLTNDLGVPVVMAVLRRRLAGQPLVTVGLSARPRLEDAAEKAFIEAASLVVRLRAELARPGPRWQPSEGFKNVSDFAWHSLAYVDPALQPQLDFLTASDVEQPMEQPAAEGTAAELLLRYTGQLARAGLDVIVVCLTTREVASVGLHVVKVLIPAAVPLNPHHRAPWLGHRRLYTVPCALGYRRQPPAPDELNLAYPHPFA